MSDIDTFESICATRGQPIEVFEITPHPGRDLCGGRFVANPDPIRVGIWKLPDEIEGGLMVCGTYHDGPPHQWHYNTGERATVAHLLAERDRLRAELQDVRDELKELRESVEWIKSVPPEEKMDQELHAASLLDLRRWERTRGPGAVGNPVLHYEDFLAFRARERGRKEAQEAMSNLQDELAAAHEEILLSRQSEGETMADLLRTRDELKELRESVEWIKSVPPEEKMDQELHAASLLDLRRWERTRGPGAVGNPVLHYEDFLAFRARERGRKEAQEAMSNLQDELAAAHEEILLSRQSEGETMADLLRTRDELAKHGPSCDHCQSSHCCSVAGCTPPLCVTDPEGSLPLWMPWTNEEVRKCIDAVYAQVDALQAELAKARNLIGIALPHVQASAGAEHMLDGFRPRRRPIDDDVDAIRAALANNAKDEA